MSNEPKIDILMATYNGERYLEDQIESILNQTFGNIRLLIHDDGSTDSTVEIIKKYQRKYPIKVFLIEDGIRCGGAKENFAHLMGFAEGDYIMFSDQDDIWLKDKIEITLKKMLECEKRFGENTPIVVYTDLKIVDSNLKTISQSFWKFSRINPYRNSLKHLILQNPVIGCTSMINKALLINSLPIPEGAIIHDWWLGLICRCLNGHINPIQKQTVLYRQHNSNAFGAKDISPLKVAKRYILNPLTSLKNSLNFAERIRKQIYSLYSFLEQRRYHNKFLEEVIEVIDSPLRRKMFFLKNKCLSDYYLLKIWQILFI